MITVNIRSYDTNRPEDGPLHDMWRYDQSPDIPGAFGMAVVWAWDMVASGENYQCDDRFIITAGNITAVVDVEPLF